MRNYKIFLVAIVFINLTACNKSFYTKKESNYQNSSVFRGSACRESYYPKPNKQDRDEYFSWIREQGKCLSENPGDPDMNFYYPDKIYP